MASLKIRVLCSETFIPVENARVSVNFDTDKSLVLYTRNNGLTHSMPFDDADIKNDFIEIKISVSLAGFEDSSLNSAKIYKNILSVYPIILKPI